MALWWTSSTVRLKSPIIAMGMTLVIALGGTDISVGALVAVAGAFALKFLRWDVTLYPTPGDYTVYPFIIVIAVPLIICTLMGLFNGLLIGKLKLQPIIATLILMVAGRGIAQIATTASSSRPATPLTASSVREASWACRSRSSSPL